MRRPTPLGSLSVQSHDLMPAGTQALKRNGRLVWIGPLGAPIEDADFDTIIVSSADFERFKARFDT